MVWLSEITVHKYFKPDYRMGRGMEVQVDNDQLVRTVVVGMRPRDSREKSLPYQSKNLYRVRLPVQRLVVIAPVDEIPEEMTAEVPEADVIADESLKTSNHANSRHRQRQQDLPDEEEPSDTYPDEIERTKDLLGTQLYEAIHTMEDIQEEDAMFEDAL